MLKQFNLKKADNSKLSFERPCVDFIPYACHYSKDTIVTKNNELLKVIKLSELSKDPKSISNDIDANFLDLRQVIRKAIRLNTFSNKVSYWITTVRCKKDVSLPSTHKEGFSKEVNDSWNKENSWHDKYVNDLYITVIVGDAYDSNSASASVSKANKFQDFISKLSFKKVKQIYLESFEKHSQELEDIVKGISGSLKAYSPKILSIYKEEEIYYSEILTFFANIINMQNKPVALDTMDFSSIINNQSFVFGNNAVEVLGDKGSVFGKGLHLKEYQEKDTPVIETILNVPQEFIITETVDFLSKEEASKYYDRQRYIFQVSKDQELSDALGIYDDSEDSNDMDYVNSQIQIFFNADNLEKLNKNIQEITAIFRKFGLVFVNIDLFFEDNFWSQLPANYLYINKKNPLLTRFIGAFAYLNSIPFGYNKNNLWGDAVTIFNTINQTPYYFNFHTEDNGHTVIMGPKFSGKTTLMNFIISEAQKFNGKLFYFTSNTSSEEFTNSISGKSLFFNQEGLFSKYQFNPFGIDDSESNRLFLSKWLKLLVFQDPLKVTEKEDTLINNALDHLYSLPKEKRCISNIIDVLGPEVSISLKDFYKEGKYAKLFDNVEENISLLESIHSFSFLHFVEDKKLLKLLLSYLFHKIEILLDGTPTIIAIDGIYKFIDNSLFSFGFEVWLDNLKKKNALLFLTLETSRSLPINISVYKKLSTKIFLPGIDLKSFGDSFGFTNIEKSICASLKSKNREFMLNKDQDSIILCSQLENIKKVNIMSCKLQPSNG